MTYADHTTAWRRLRRALFCLTCRNQRDGCPCPRRRLGDRVRRLWRKLARRRAVGAAQSHRLAQLRRQIAFLNSRVAALDTALAEERARRRQAEAQLAAERYAKDALLATMTPGRPRRERN